MGVLLADAVPLREGAAYISYCPELWRLCQEKLFRKENVSQKESIIQKENDSMIACVYEDDVTKCTE
jgi:hypothetical protein